MPLIAGLFQTSLSLANSFFLKVQAQSGQRIPTAKRIRFTKDFFRQLVRQSAQFQNLSTPEEQQNQINFLLTGFFKSSFPEIQIPESRLQSLAQLSLEQIFPRSESQLEAQPPTIQEFTAKISQAVPVLNQESPEKIETLLDQIIQEVKAPADSNPPDIPDIPDIPDLPQPSSPPQPAPVFNPPPVFNLPVKTAFVSRLAKSTFVRGAKKAAFSLAAKAGLSATGAGAVAVIAWEGAKKIGGFLKKGFKKIFNTLSFWGEKKAYQTGQTLPQTVDSASAVLKTALLGGGITILGFTLSPLILVVILTVAILNLLNLLPFGASTAAKVNAFIPNIKTQAPEQPDNSQYITIQKTASPSHLTNQQVQNKTPVAYTITINAPAQDLNNLKINESISLQNSSGITPITLDINGIPISAYFSNLPNLTTGETRTINFTIQTDPSFQNSTLFNQIEVAADIPNLSSSSQQKHTAKKTLAIYIGEPSECGFCRAPPLASNLLKQTFEQAGQTFGVPASMLLGLAHFEGRWMFNLDDNQVSTRLTEGSVSPENCSPNDCGARGPMQFLSGTSGPNPANCPAAYPNGLNQPPISVWSSYQNAVQAVEPSRTPDICNLKDAIFAAAKKLRANVAIASDPTEKNCPNIKGAENQLTKNDCPKIAPAACAWTKGDIYHALAHWYGNCTANYCATVYNQYYQEYSCQP